MNLIANIRRMHVVRGSIAPRSRRRRGVAAVEFALTIPIWITILLGVADGTFCLLVNEKADRIAYSITDIVTQYQTISNAQLGDVVDAAAQLMSPITFGANGVAIITSIYKAQGANPTICWQYTGGGTLPRSSKIGASNNATNCANGTVATLPNGLVLNDYDNVVVTEVYYAFTPMFVSAALFKSGDVYRVAVYKPRLSPLITPPT